MTHIESNTFAEACYNQNTIDELKQALNEEADQSDMLEWKIDASTWHAQIKLALAAKLENLLKD